jgi:hypothetical protein
MYYATNKTTEEKRYKGYTLEEIKTILLTEHANFKNEIYPLNLFEYYDTMFENRRKIILSLNTWIDIDIFIRDTRKMSFSDWFESL